MRLHLLILGLTAAALAGCQAVPARDEVNTALLPPSVVVEAVAGEDAAESPTNNANILLANTEAPSLPTRGNAPAAARPIALSLLDAVELCLSQNPDLQAARAAEGVSAGALGVAQTYPFNPYVQIQVTPSQQNAASPPTSTAHYVLLMQTLQLAHQRFHRADAAAAALHSVRWSIVQAELQATAQTQRLFFTAQYLHGLRDLAQSNAEMNRQLLDLATKQLAAGQASGADVAITRLDDLTARRQAQLAQANYLNGLLDLRRQLGLPLSTPLELTGQLADWNWKPAADDDQLQNLEQLALSLTAGRPDVYAACCDVEAARANLRLAQANRIPDLTIGPYYQRNDSGTTFWGFRAQSDIPIMNSGAPLVRQRLAELMQRQTVWEQLSTRASLEAQAALDRYRRALQMTAESGTGPGETLPKELARLEAQFKAQEIDLVRVITARTSFFQARRAQLDALNELAQASAAVVATTGLPPQKLIEPTSAK